MKTDDLVSALNRPEPATYTLRETAALLGCSYNGLWLQVQEGRAPVTPVRVGRVWKFPRATVNALLAITPTDAIA